MLVRTTRISSSTSSRVVARRAVRGRRLASTTTTSASSSSTGAGPSSAASGDAWRYTLAGAAGGGSVLLGGYAYYHFSGAKALVDRAHSIRSSVLATTNSLSSTFLPSTDKKSEEEIVKKRSETLGFLRQLAKSYAGLVPGGSMVVDRTFDELELLSEEHGVELQKILGDAATEVRSTVKEGQLDVPTTEKVVSILQKYTSQLSDLAAKASSSSFQKLIDNAPPELKDSFQGGWDELKKTADSFGDEAGEGVQKGKEVIQDTTWQLYNILKDGFTPEKLNEARKVVQEKTEELKDIASKGTKMSKEAFEKKLQPYLDKLPTSPTADSIKSLLTSNASLLTSSSAVASAGAIWSTLKSKLGDAKDGNLDLDEVKKTLEEQVEEVKKKAGGGDAGSGGGDGGKGMGQLGGAWKGMRGFLESAVPGADKIPKEIDSLIALASDPKASEQGKKLAKETYDEVLEVLRSKGEEAKKLADGQSGGGGEGDEDEGEGGKKAEGKGKEGKEGKDKSKGQEEEGQQDQDQGQDDAKSDDKDKDKQKEQEKDKGKDKSKGKGGDKDKSKSK